jgi:hypothetical protein
VIMIRLDGQHHADSRHSRIVCILCINQSMSISSLTLGLVLGLAPLAFVDWGLRLRLAGESVSVELRGERVLWPSLGRMLRRRNLFGLAPGPSYWISGAASWSCRRPGAEFPAPKVGVFLFLPLLWLGRRRKSG